MNSSSATAPATHSRPPARNARPVARGKFIFIGDEKFFMRGVTYGPFRPDAEGWKFPARGIVENDFSQMAAVGVNAVRVYTVPPLWLLDVAREHGLFVLVGLPGEQQMAFLSQPELLRAIEQGVRAGVRACRQHPAVLGYVIANEIPAHVVRWHGRRRIEKFLKKLYRIAKNEDPLGLVTYVNYPSTEYLQLPFIDIFCFNLFLESPVPFAAYLARLQNLAGNRPLLLTEIGLDSRRNGLERQAETLDWQIRSAFAGGCAGVFIFGWTDDWHHGGFDIENWNFGIVTRDRAPKPALAAVGKAFTEIPFPSGEPEPRISVIVCTHNGARTLRECLGALQKLRYRNYEIIVVNDGSRDHTASIALEFGVQLITTENRGLSSARNTGFAAATGEIVVYLDDDAFPDPDWLTYLAATFRKTNHVAVGGPNIAPPNDGNVAECVDNAPGGPVHVLLNDTEAEHIPGCNFAIRKSCLQEIGGFDPQFRTAGDDVDLCWRLLRRGWTIGFNPGAVVWHHRRNSIRAYWRQQKGYGKAEALLERKWPEKYNAIGHVKWAGRLYGGGLTRMLINRQHVYHGSWGTAPFQMLHEAAPGLLPMLPMMPEWYLVILAFGGLSALAFLWPKLIFVLPLFGLAGGVTIWQAVLSAAQASFSNGKYSRLQRFQLHTLTALLHLMQPLARLWGRIRHGLTAFRRRDPRVFTLPILKQSTVWSETWRSPGDVLGLVVSSLQLDHAILVFGGEYDLWDVEIRGGLLGAARMFVIVEEHGAGKQFYRFRRRPHFKMEAVVPFFVFAALSAGAAFDQSWTVCGVLAGIALLLLMRTLFEAGFAMGLVERALKRGFGGTGN